MYIQFFKKLNNLFTKVKEKNIDSNPYYNNYFIMMKFFLSKRHNRKHILSNNLNNLMNLKNR